MLRFRVPDWNRFCGGVGGLEVGAGPAEPWDTFPMLPYCDLLRPGPYCDCGLAMAICRGMAEVTGPVTPCPIWSRLE